MRFRLLRLEEFPLGTRILRPGSQGGDVKDLQELLTQNGFYAGNLDGQYGPLTEESVRLLERTSRITVDGIAGREVIDILKNPSRHNGRMIYIIKAGDNLKNISRKFNVNSIAWHGIPGQSNPKYHLHPGMRLLLHQKALFLWEDVMADNSFPSKDRLSKLEQQLRTNIKPTHFIRPTWRIDGNGDLASLGGELESRFDTYQVIQASPEVWNAFFTSKTLRNRFYEKLRRLKSSPWGLDLRAAPLNTIVFWPKLLKSICTGIHTRAIRFLILPILPPSGHGQQKHTHMDETPIFWFSLSLIAKFVELLIFEPLFSFENPQSYENLATKLPEILMELRNRHLNHKSLLWVSPSCWDWNLDQNTNQSVPYSKAKMIRAVNPRSTQYSSRSQLTMIGYTSRRQAHCLVYRDIQGFTELFALLNQSNLFGLVIRNFEVLGKPGIELIQNSFTILPPLKLQFNKQA
jgi:hypothetical protein